VCFLVSCCGILGMGTHFNTSDVMFRKIVPTNEAGSKDRPSPCSHHRMVLHGHHLYVVGGRNQQMENEIQNKRELSMNVYSFDLIDRKWTLLYDCSRAQFDDGPAPRENHGLVYYNDRLYVFGGGTSREPFSLQVKAHVNS
jgi:hypothetical protein